MHYRHWLAGNMHRRGLSHPLLHVANMQEALQAAPAACLAAPPDTHHSDAEQPLHKEGSFSRVVQSPGLPFASRRLQGRVPTIVMKSFATVFQQCSSTAN